MYRLERLTLLSLWVPISAWFRVVVGELVVSNPIEKKNEARQIRSFPPPTFGVKMFNKIYIFEVSLPSYVSFLGGEYHDMFPQNRPKFLPVNF